MLALAFESLELEAEFMFYKAIQLGVAVHTYILRTQEV